MNVFSTTDPNEVVIGDLQLTLHFANHDISNFSSRALSLKMQASTEPPRPMIMETATFKPRINKYDLVMMLMPEFTSVTEDFLGIVVRNSLISSPEFLETVLKIKEKDEKTISYFTANQNGDEKSIGSNSRYNSRNSTG